MTGWLVLAIAFGFFRVTIVVRLLDQIMRFASLRSPRWWTGAIVALLAGGWIAPAPARAGCGDYVAIPGEFRNHSMPDSNEPSTNVPSHRPQQPFSPCSSAACLPPGDMALAGASLSGEIDQWACGNSVRAVLTVEMDCLLIPENLHQLQGADTGIFHPPRISMN
jgi:hypothetical protein